jgi:hypothetical protein
MLDTPITLGQITFESNFESPTGQRANPEKSVAAIRNRIPNKTNGEFSSNRGTQGIFVRMVSLSAAAAVPPSPLRELAAAEQHFGRPAA